MHDGWQPTSTVCAGIRIAALASLLALATTPAQALFKVVGPDGSVTYTDRPPVGAPSVPVAVTGAPRAASAAPPVGGDAPSPLPAPAPSATGWPATLREAVKRFPVTLYTAAGCVPCEDARRLLQRRGVPYSERLVRSEEDARRLEQLTGARMVPAATVGRKALIGLQEQDWQDWLDTAGYPRTRVLPTGWQPAPAAPLTPAPGPAAQGASAPSAGLPRAASPLPRVEPRPGPAGSPRS